MDLEPLNPLSDLKPYQRELLKISLDKKVAPPIKIPQFLGKPPPVRGRPCHGVVYDEHRLLDEKA